MLAPPASTALRLANVPWPYGRRRRVAELDAHVVQRQPELVGHELRERRLVTLAVVVARHLHEHLPGRIHPHASAES